jgi:hypothetical protein
MSSSKKFTCIGDFAAGVYLSETQNPIPPSHTHCIRIYSILIHTGKSGGGRVELERRGEGQQGREQITSWVANTNMTECTQEIC